MLPVFTPGPARRFADTRQSMPRHPCDQQQSAKKSFKNDMKPVRARLPGEGVDLGRPAASDGGDGVVNQAVDDRVAQQRAGADQKHADHDRQSSRHQAFLRWRRMGQGDASSFLVHRGDDPLP